MEQSIDGFYRSRVETGNGFVGQMSEDFQSRLVRANACLTLDECSFYHTMDLGNDEVVEGIWDLREGERSYLGYVDLSGLRILEFGPASGHLSVFMEKQGAEVVCFDLAPGMAQDIVPQAGSGMVLGGSGIVSARYCVGLPGWRRDRYGEALSCSRGGRDPESRPGGRFHAFVADPGYGLYPITKHGS